jgi:BirA family biotin operon repressor/biotin-[acetyl-CoA-carboxylase] ligase
MGLQLAFQEQGKGGAVRGAILEVLRKHDGNWVSGEELSRILGMSRAAVSKHMRLIRDAGYPVEAMTRRGYRLGGDADSLHPAAVCHGLGTRLLGRGTVLHMESVPSTNMEARVLAERGAPEGSVVLADCQTAGRGRQGRTWLSPRGGVYMSVVLRPQCAPQQVPVLTLMTVVAVVGAVRGLTGLPAMPKWPNDVLVHGRKLSGVLIEAGLVVDALDYAVAGIGINVNTVCSELERDGMRAVSLRGALEAHHGTEQPQLPRAGVARAVLEALEEAYELFRSGGGAAVVARWKQLAGITGSSIRLGRGDAVLTGKVRDVDDNGWLLLEDESGTVHRLPAGDILDG